MKKKIGIITSGGDSPGMNAILFSIFNFCFLNNIKCIGFKYGFSGLIKNKKKKIYKKDINNIIGLGGTILGAGRSNLFYTKKGRAKAYINILKNNLYGLIIIGGNGTFKGVKIFSKEYKNIPIIGIPGTIDNDINGTDLTIGYDTSNNTIIKTINKIQDTAISNNRIFIIEVMGKKTGFLALNSGLSLGALYIIYKSKYNLKKIIQNIEKKKSNIIIVAENENIGDFSKEIFNKLKKKSKKYDFRLNILGHLQRGGSPTCLDRILALRLGLESIKKLKNFKKNLVIGIKNNKIKYIPFKKAILKKKISKNLIKLYKFFYY